MKTNDYTSRIAALRQRMSQAGIDAFIIPSADPHQSEYPADRWKSRAWISGFTGSAGTAVITATDGGVWTDSRYFLQAAEELKASGLQLFKEGLPETPSLQAWLAATLPTGATVAIDGTTCSHGEGERMEAYFKSKGLGFKTDFAPFDEIWQGRPGVPSGEAFVYPTTYSGKSLDEKWADVQQAVIAQGGNAILVCALDELAWLLNIRGNDVAYNPVAVGFAYFSASQRILFMDKVKISDEMAAYLRENAIELRPYDSIYAFVQEIPSGDKVVVDPGKTNYQLTHLLPLQQQIRCASPITWLKSLKNETEMKGRREAMVRDGAAMVQFLYWLDTHIGKEPITELDIDEKLREFRSRQPLYKGESFATIAGYREHGAETAEDGHHADKHFTEVEQFRRNQDNADNERNCNEQCNAKFGRRTCLCDAVLHLLCFFQKDIRTAVNFRFPVLFGVVEHDVLDALDAVEEVRIKARKFAAVVDARLFERP